MNNFLNNDCIIGGSPPFNKTGLEGADESGKERLYAILNDFGDNFINSITKPYRPVIFQIIGINNLWNKTK